MPLQTQTHSRALLCMSARNMMSWSAFLWGASWGVNANANANVDAACAALYNSSMCSAWAERVVVDLDTGARRPATAAMGNRVTQ